MHSRVCEDKSHLFFRFVKLSFEQDARERSAFSSGAEERAAAGLAHTLQIRRNHPFKTPLTSIGKKTGLKRVDTEMQLCLVSQETIIAKPVAEVDELWF